MGSIEKNVLASPVLGGNDPQKTSILSFDILEEMV
jgi:hypothetical protein